MVGAEGFRNGEQTDVAGGAPGGGRRRRDAIADSGEMGGDLVQERSRTAYLIDATIDFAVSANCPVGASLR